MSGCGFESQRRILDGVSEASYYIGKREIKVAKWGMPKKIKIKIIIINLRDFGSLFKISPFSAVF